MIGNYNSDDYFDLTNEVQNIYANMEEEITMTVAKRIQKGITDPGWAELKLAEATKIADAVNDIAVPYSNLAQDVVESAILTAYEKGYNSANQDLNILRGLWAEKKVPNKIQNLVLEGKALVNNTHFNILRSTTDDYRRIVYDAIRESTAGGKTRQQAAAIALNKFADKGITGFIDKSGRRWEISSYVEMATRTAAGRAAIEGHVDRQAEAGRDLVIVSDHPSECPLCRPWEGKILSISGTDPKYPSLNSAISAGLFHPNCRHTITGYIPGLTQVVPGKPDPSGYELSQKQRANERQIRKWKRREAAAIEPNDKEKAASKVRYWQKQQRELLEGTGIKRKYDRESISIPKVKPLNTANYFNNKVKVGTVYKDANSLTNLSKPLEVFFDVIDDEAIALAAQAITITNNKVVQGKDLVGKYKYIASESQFDFDIEDVLHEQGFDGLPTLLDEVEFNKIKEETGFFAKRVYAADSQELLDEYRNQLYNGKFYVDCSTGGAQYGQGMYSAAMYDVKAGVYNSKSKDLLDGLNDEIGHYIELSKSRGFNFYNVEDITLHPDAKIFTLPLNVNADFYIDKKYSIEIFKQNASPAQMKLVNKYEKLLDEWYSMNRDTHTSNKIIAARKKVDKVEYELLESNLGDIVSESLKFIKEDGTKGWKNMGTLVAEMGYDAINATGHGESGSYTVILNRTKMIILDKN